MTRLTAAGDRFESYHAGSPLRYDASSAARMSGSSPTSTPTMRRGSNSTKISSSHSTFPAPSGAIFHYESGAKSAPSAHLARCDVTFQERDVRTDPMVDAIESTQSTIPRSKSDWPRMTDWTLMPLSSLICFE